MSANSLDPLLNVSRGSVCLPRPEASSQPRLMPSSPKRLCSPLPCSVLKVRVRPHLFCSQIFLLPTAPPTQSLQPHDLLSLPASISSHLPPVTVLQVPGSGCCSGLMLSLSCSPHPENSSPRYLQGSPLPSAQSHYNKYLKQEAYEEKKFSLHFVWFWHGTGTSTWHWLCPIMVDGNDTSHW